MAFTFDRIPQCPEKWRHSKGESRTPYEVVGSGSIHYQVVDSLESLPLF